MASARRRDEWTRASSIVWAAFRAAGAKTVKPSDFMPRFGPEPELTPEQRAFVAELAKKPMKGKARGR